MGVHNTCVYLSIFFSDLFGHVTVFIYEALLFTVFCVLV